MTTSCPVCNKSVDPLRSRFVAVLHGKVVAYCSADCARAQRPAEARREVTPSTGPTAATGVPARAATPATGVPVRSPTPAVGVAAGPPRPYTPAPGVPVMVDSGPVIEILHEPASGVVTSARDERIEPRAQHPDEIPMAVFWSADKDPSGAVGAAAPTPAPAAGRADTLDKWANDDTTGRGRTDRSHSEADPEPAPGGRRWRLVILVLLLLAAGGVYLYQYIMKNGLAAATRARSTPRASAAPRAAALPSGASAGVAPARPAEPAPLDVGAAVERARATLQADLSATSPRLQRIAAAALARTQDPEARKILAAHLGVAATRDAAAIDISEIARLDLAYSLARGGDPRGGAALAAALGSQRAELRDEASRLLALLRDPRGVPHLTDLLAVSQRRLGAAEHLAHLAEPHAIKILRQICNDARASADDKARATIALGIAGHADVAPALRDMLRDPHFNAFAAAALAELKDRAAQPVLEHQLDSPSLRVRAARALRRLDPALDPRPVLPHLLEVLKTGRDTEQVQAAEAILVLAGPISWSAYD